MFVGSHRIHGNRAPRADWVTDRAISLLRRFDGGRFFLYLHYMDPHADYDPPAGWARFGWTDDERYLGEIAFCDSQIGRLLDALRSLGRDRDTLVVFIADHGEAFGEHGFRGHGWTLHREEIQVPLILRLPGRIPAGRRVPCQVRSIDAHATVLACLGLSVPRHVEGESLLPLLAAGAAGGDRPAFSETIRTAAPFRPQVCLHDGCYKAILDVEADALHLYDVVADRPERTDLSRQRPDIAAAMARRIQRFQRDRRPLHAATQRPLSNTERRILRNLGYLDPGR